MTTQRSSCQFMAMLSLSMVKVKEAIIGRATQPPGLV